MRKLFLFFGVVSFAAISMSAKEYSVVSPDGQIRITVDAGKTLTWSVEHRGEQVVEPSEMALDIEGMKVRPGVNPKVKKVSRKSVDNVLHPVVPTKFSEIQDRYNEMTLRMAGDYSVEFRAYDNGAAYRFVMNRPGKMTVSNETVEFNMPDGTRTFWPTSQPMRHNYMSSQESIFTGMPVDSVNADMTGYLPIYTQSPKGTRVVITEADVDDYSNLFLQGTSTGRLHGVFPKVIKDKRMKRPDEGWGSDRTEIVLELEPYMAVTGASRTLPWRVAMISPDDAGLLENTLVWQLAKPSVLDDTSWIRPGLISWDWWSGVNVYSVDFEAGINNDTYRYFIDFAAKNGIGYILIDEGWSASTSDIQHYKKDVDIEELVAYGKERGVGIFIWALWNPLEKNLEGILDTYEKWGVKGIKIDFMDRSDQEMVNFYENVAREAAKRHLMVDFHGAYKPSGLHRKYPNVLTFEGVFGNENNKWGEGHVTPAHTIMLPFIRNLAGPMDYTPGAVKNATREDYYSMGAHPMSLGTRAHEAALFVVYESPLQMICDSPSNYNSAPDYLKLLSGMPVVWDETVGIDALMGQYLVMARRSGDKWYIAALTDWTPRDMEVKLDFLPQGKWSMETFADGVNAHREATDTRIGHQTVSTGDSIKFHMAPGGGWVAVLTPVE